MRTEVRAATLVAGAALVIVAFAAATRVADTREGLVAEVVTLLSGLVAVALLMYGLAARRGQTPAPRSAPQPGVARPRTTRDLALGAGGLTLALILLVGLEVSGGPLWAGLGLVLLLPMISGCVYLCARFLRAQPLEDKTSPTR